MLPRLLCKLLGHKFSGQCVSIHEGDGRVTKWCLREKQRVLIFPGWDAINSGADT